MKEVMENATKIINPNTEMILPKIPYAKINSLNCCLPVNFPCMGRLFFLMLSMLFRRVNVETGNCKKGNYFLYYYSGM